MNFKNLSQLTSPYRSRLIINSFKPWIKKGDKILDIGCGTGISTVMIKDNFKAEVTGCDVRNYLAVDLPFYKIPKNGKFPFKNNTFDNAMLNDVLHHTKKPQQLVIIKDSLRVARQVLIFEVEPTILGKIFDVILNKLHYKGLATPLTFRSSGEWEELFESLGYQHSVKSVKTPMWYPFSHIAIRLKAKDNEKSK